MKKFNHMNSDIVVSISCITYNHEPYIRECLDGFLMQKCDFGFEVLIHDDASTDNTQAIIREYQQKYPDIIKPILREENLYSKGERSFNARFNFTRALGKYIALCEGDDYWTDPLKLQKQVDFMEKNPEIVFSFHGGKKLNPNGEFSKFHSPQMLDNVKVNKSEFITRGGAAFQTATAMFTFALFEGRFPSYYQISPVGDFALALLVTDKGEIGYIPDEMAVYRYMHDTSWTKSRSFKEKVNNSLKFMRTVEAFNKETDYRFSNECNLLMQKANSSIVTSYIVSSSSLIGLIKLIQYTPRMGLSNAVKNLKTLVNKIISNN